ncbi:MAG: M56 family metallopeptidase [Bacteroides sp.]|nr:M56 family metallopeptidase [Bacteroides sp.]
MIQLVRCVLLSFVLFILIFLLRKTILKNRVFLKGTLWSLFIPVLFIGRMKFFYEDRIGVKLFSWLTELCMSHIWICWLYLCGIFVYTALLFFRKRKLKKTIVGMEKRKVNDTVIYVTKIPVTPSTAGVLAPKIIIPKVILKKYDRKELQTILLHEKTHIRQGHLLFYFLWDMLRALLWLNPLLTTGTKYFREDMEEICDFITIKKSGGSAYNYGQLLLKCIRTLQAENKDFNMYATFAGDREYQSIRQRVKRIASYKPYKKTKTAATQIAAALCAAVTVIWTQNVSYGRCNPLDSIVVYDMKTGAKLVSDEKALREAVDYDENYIYIDSEAFQALIKGNTVSNENICFYCGGYYKLPGIGGGGGCGYSETAEAENGILKIKYEIYEDILGYILKII